MHFLDETVDLASDMRYALSRPGADGLKKGAQDLKLEGLYRFQADGLLEVELTETKTLQRTVVYVSDTGALIFIPPGVYDFYYRNLSATHTVTQFLIRRIGLIGKFAIYGRKIVGLGLSPKKWHSAIKSRRLKRHRAVGLALKTQASSPLTVAMPPAPNFTAQRIRPREPVSIIIPTKTRFDLLDACIASLEPIRDIAFEIIIVDNGADHPAMLELLSTLGKRENVTILRHEAPFNFSELCNLGAREARHPLLLFLNDDIEALDADWLGYMVDALQTSGVGCVGARLLYPSGDLQHGGIAANMLPGPGHPWRGVSEDVWTAHPLLAHAGEVDAVTGACLMIDKGLFAEIGGFDEKRFPVSMNDVDLSLKVRRSGKRVVYCPQATLVHKESQSRTSDDAPENLARRSAELKAFVELYPDYARSSVFYPLQLRRDTEMAEPIPMLQK